jgi:hypothetical protein
MMQGHTKQGLQEGEDLQNAAWAGGVKVGRDPMAAEGVGFSTLLADT